jgi:hypothetical protein
MAQQITVAFIVLAAALYSAWSLMPAVWRRGAAARVASGARRWGVTQRRADRLEQALGSRSGCSECSSCKGCAAPASPRASAATAPAAVIAMPEKFAGRRQG